jgi:hypothetical protein
MYVLLVQIVWKYEKYDFDWFIYCWTSIPNFSLAYQVKQFAAHQRHTDNNCLAYGNHEFYTSS